MTEIPDLSDTIRMECDVLVIGGGTAGTMAALTAADDEHIALEPDGVLERGGFH